MSDTKKRRKPMSQAQKDALRKGREAAKAKRDAQKQVEANRAAAEAPTEPDKTFDDSAGLVEPTSEVVADLTSDPHGFEGRVTTFGPEVPPATNDGERAERAQAAVEAAKPEFSKKVVLDYLVSIIKQREAIDIEVGWNQAIHQVINWVEHDA